MIKNTITTHRLRRLVSISALLFVSASLCQAQRVSQYDRGTPPQHVAGVSPVGSYISSDLGTVNVANGALNIKVPLGEAGGRGFWLPISLNYSSKVWSLSGDTDFADETHQRTVVGAVYGQAQYNMDFFCRLAPGWTYGAVPFLRAQGVHIRPYAFGGSCDYHYALVKLTLVMPDKGEIELRDDSFDGEPRPAQTTGSCLARDANRGTRWHATDGSGTIFVSDLASSGVSYGDLSGTIITADGMRYHFANWDYPGSIQDTIQIHNLARCDLITDRNGNFVQITNSTGNLKLIQFTDQLGRVTTLQKNAPDPDNPTGPKLPLLVTLPGYQGQPRYYKVLTDTMNLHYRSDQNPGSGVAVIVGDHSPGFFDYTWQGPHISLFPSSEGLLNVEIDTQVVVTQVVLPDGRTLNFNYNQFGEVSEVQLFTGAKIQYDYDFATLPAGNTLFQETRAQMNSVSVIDRAVVARRNYEPNTTIPEASWSYSYGSLTPSNSSIPAPATEVTCTSSGTQLLHERHFFLPGGRYFDGIDTGMKGVDGTHYTIWSTGLEFRSETFDLNGTTVLAASETDWSQRAGVVWTGGYLSYINEQQEQPGNDNRTTESRKFLDDGSMARVQTSYDDLGPYPRANNPKTADEYDFGGAIKRHSETTYSGSYVSDSIHLLRLPLQTSTYDMANGTLFAQTTFEYDNYTADGNHAALQSYSPDAYSHASGYGLTYTTRGNPTQIAHMIDNASSVYSYPRYDVLGNVVSMKDPRTNVTTISYQDDFGDGSNPGSGSSGSFGATYALPTLITSPPPNPGEPPHTARTQFDFSTGLMTGFKDSNLIITQTLYNDPFDRPTLIKSGTNTSPSIENRTAMYYAPQTNPFGVNLANNDVLTAKDQAGLNDGNLRSWTHTDGFGRTVESWTSDPQSNVHVVTSYDGLGRVSKTSNPFRIGETQYDTTTGYDLAGRIRTVTTADNAVVTTEYNGAAVMVTDQAGKRRISQNDGLGRLTDVWEITTADSATEAVTFAGYSNLAGYRTKYSYDALDDLLTVTQRIGMSGTLQTRTFLYDGLRRLTRAINPESGTINYTYDPNSNLSTKQDARLITTNITYDNLNRVTGRSYANDPQSTPAVSYKYDAQQLTPGFPAAFTRGSSIGRLVAVTYGGTSAGNYTGYDQLGRPNVSYQQTDSLNYGLSNYSYNLASEMTSQTYPSGRIVQTEYDTAGRVAGVKNQANSFYYVGAAASDSTNRIQYASHGAVSAMKLGNGRWERTSFNSRLQPTQITLDSTGGSNNMQLDYGYGTTNNNGNVLSQTITVPGPSGGLVTLMPQTYSYDSLNRVASVSENTSPGWTQTYDYDRFGNRAVRNTSTPIPTRQTPTSSSPSDLSFLFNQANNHITATSEYVYDPTGSGNLTSMPNRTSGADSMTYDAENRQKTYALAGAGTTTYYYDGDGRRVKKTDPNNNATVFVYNVSSQLIAEYTTAPAAAGDTSYLTTDHLGSTRTVTDSGGNVKARYDYLPFGEEIGAGVGARTVALGYVGSGSTRQKFTQKERDNESGLDYFGERYYSSAQGRFTSCDPLGSSIRASDPQTMNRYVFVLNNPLRYVDPDGLKEKSPWELLSDEERTLLAPKLVSVKDASKLTVKELSAAGSAFNRMVTVEGNAEGTATNIAGVQDFIAAAGGYKNSKVWQDITSIVAVTFGGPPPAGDYPVQSSEIQVTVADKKTFLADLQKEGYEVNTLGDKLFRGTYHPFDNASALTPRIKDPQLHFANNKSNEPDFGPNYFFAHWDRASSHSREGGPIGDMAAGLSHSKGQASPQAVRDYLKRTRQYPTR